MEKQYLYWIWLNELKGVGPVTAKRLLQKFITPKNIYNATKEELKELCGIGENLSENIIESRNLDHARIILDKCNKENINIVTYKEEKFPLIINNYSGMPILLYYMGKLYDNISGVAIVGSRRCSDYGKQVTVEAATFLAENKIPVISGMAKGIDSYAHTACIKSEGYTIAILGCGLDICYPKEHRELMGKIINHGALISEYKPGTMPSKQNFPKRNRLISACSEKILIVEAGENSGALITAQYAEEQGKQIFAVPNNIYIKEGRGTNKLIAEGTNIYLNPSQLIINNTVNLTKRGEVEAKDKHLNISYEENLIFNLIKTRSCTLDEIVLLLKLDKSNITEVLFSMELKGLIRCYAGRYSNFN